MEAEGLARDGQSCNLAIFPPFQTPPGPRLKQLYREHEAAKSVKETLANMYGHSVRVTEHLVPHICVPYARVSIAARVPSPRYRPHLNSYLHGNQAVDQAWPVIVFVRKQLTDMFQTNLSVFARQPLDRLSVTKRTNRPPSRTLKPEPAPSSLSVSTQGQGPTAIWPFGLAADRPGLRFN